VNTAIFSPSGGSIGIGFAIPSNMAKNVVAQLIKYGKPRRGWLGVRIQQVTPDIAESVGLKSARGVMVAGVTAGGPADKAGIANGDIILKFNNQDVKELHNLPRMVAETPIGAEVPVVVWHNGQEQTLTVKIGEMPEEEKQLAAATPAPAGNEPLALSGLGLKIAPITPELRDKFSLAPDQKGVVITDVAPDSNAAERGLRPGDVIVQVQQEEVNSPAEVEQRLNRARKQNRKMVLLLIQGQDGLRWVPLPVSSAKGKEPG
jgi:serine protease Do